MRTSFLLVSSVLFATAIAACGGDDGGNKIIDAGSGSGSDSGSATCDIMANYTVPDIGTTAAPLEGDYFDMPTSGQLMGRTIFTPVLAGLAGSTMTSTDIIELDVLKPSGAMGAFPVNSAITFGSTAVMSIAANVNLSTQGDPTQAYLAGAGSITITAIGQTDGSMITGSVTAATFMQIDPNTGAPMGTCTSATNAFNFYLKQMAASNRTAPQPTLRSLATLELAK